MGIEHLKKRVESSKEDRANRGSGGNWQDRIPQLKPQDGETVIFQLMANLDECPLVKVHDFIDMPGGKKMSFSCTGDETCQVCKNLSTPKERKLKDKLVIPVYVPDFEGTTYEGKIREQVDGRWVDVKKTLPRPVHYFLVVGPGKDDKYHQFFIDEFEDNDKDLTGVQIRMKVQGEGLDRDITYKVMDPRKFEAVPMKTDVPKEFPELDMESITAYAMEQLHIPNSEYTAKVQGKKSGGTSEASKETKSQGAAGW
jgi:hypothetical protein